MPGPGGRFHGAPIEKAHDVRGTLRRLLSWLRPYGPALGAVAILVVGSTLLDLLAPFLMGLAIDRFIALDDLAGLQRVVLLMIGAYVGAWLAKVAQNRIMARVSQQVMNSVS